MSYVPSQPTLSYVSSVDVTSAANQGLTKYQIVFDSDLVTLGNLIMFEYKFQTSGAVTANLNNTAFGFISVEDAIQAGIENQYVIAVPALENTYDGIVDNTIQVRVYFGITSSSNNVLVTPWSNALNVYNPPVQPVIYTDPSLNFEGAFYDPSGADTLYVLLDPSQNPYDYDALPMKFVVCYFYQDVSDVTVWNVSDPLVTTLTIFGTRIFRLITVPNIGTVSTTVPYNKVYVSIHAVYDWADFSNNYYAVSYMSNEVVAVESSSDTNPDITDVSYNVYNTPFPVPGNQTMNVTWIPPGNSVLPPYYVDYYNLYYRIDGSGDFTLYQANIPSTTLTYNVNVGATGLNALNLLCGQYIQYRVDVVTVTAGVYPSNISSPVYKFIYSEAVTNLVVTNVDYDPSGTTMTVNFNGVNTIGSPNKGCGDGQQYVVLINGVQYTPFSGSLGYVSGKSYSIVYTGLAVTQSGTVTVYLQTNNTNAYPASPLNGAPATAPYIANDLVLSPVVYGVYPAGNSNQNMVLPWTDPAVSPWTVVNYDVEYSTDGGATWTTETTTSLLTYTFNATSFASSVDNLQFRVLANMTTGSPAVNYTITSNIQSQYTFQYATQVTNAMLNWAATDETAITMDINVTFKNPSFLGVNNGLQFFRTTVYNALNIVITSVDVLYNTTPVYDPPSGVYTVSFNNIPYSPSGTVVIAPYVTDTNTVNNITNSLYAVTLNYNTSAVPVFMSIVSNASTGGLPNATIQCTIITNNLLKPTASFTYPDEITGILINPAIKISGLGGDVAGVTTIITPQPDGTYIYVVTINLYSFFTFGGYVPVQIYISCANNAGDSLTGLAHPVKP